MTTVATRPSFKKAKKILHDATAADRHGELERAHDLYMEAFKECNKQLQPYLDSATAIKEILNPESALGPADSPLKFSDVGGLEDCKQVLTEATIWPKKYHQFFTRNRKPWRAVLLYGPPGSGKTLLAKAIADEAGFPLRRISPSDIVSKWMGESEKQVKNIFRVAGENDRSIVFIDEIDSLCGQRGENNENEASRRIKSELLVHMQEVRDGVKDVLILAATNTPFALDQAIRRRFDKRIHVGLPDEEARKHIFKCHIGETPHNLSPEDFRYLARKTDGFSGSDISIFVKDALYEVVRATLKIEYFERSGDKLVPCQGNGNERFSLQEIDERGENSQIEVPPCTVAHFKNVLKNQKATVTKDDLKKFDDFTKEFGICG